MVVNLSSAQSESQNPRGLLRLSNGDEYKGVWLPSEGGLIRWETQWFTEPVLFDYRYLDELAIESWPQNYKVESFRVLLRNGDVLHGELAALSPDEVSLKCERHGTVRIRRSELLKLTRLNNPSLVFSGPTSLEGWTVLEAASRRTRRGGGGAPAEFWSLIPGGGLTSDRWRAELFRGLDFPDKVEIDFQLSSSERPEFSLALHEDVESAVRLETWDDALVLSHGTEFKLVRFLESDLRRLRLRLFWDRVQGNIAVYDESASLLARGKFPAESASNIRAGFFIRNKSIDMSLERLRIAKWNGKAPRRMQEQGIRIRTSDGGVLRDEIVDLEMPSYELILKSGERLPVEEIDTIYFRDDETLEEPEGLVEFSYPDGTRVSGTLLGVKPREASVQTDYVREAMQVRLGGLRQIRFPGQDRGMALETGDELHLEGEVYRGQVSGQGEAGERHPIRWKALGAQNAVPIVPEFAAHIVRRRSQAVGNLDGDRLFLKSGEILSCRIESMTEESAGIRTGLSQLREVPLDLIKAVEFREGRLQMAGFSDREWTERKTGPGSVQREAGKVTLNGGAVFHPSLLRADELYFGLSWEDKGQSAITLGLFGNQIEEGRPPLEISFTCWGNRLWVSATETSLGQMLDGDDVMIEGGRASVALKLGEERVAVSVNGIQLVQFEFENLKRTGNGLLFQSGGPWPSGETRLNPLVVDRFEIRSSTGLLSSLRVDDAVKNRALLVPRFRRDNPDQHVLIGGNGDLIRGRLVRVTSSEIEFISRLRELKIPRERLAGLVVLEDEAFSVEEVGANGEVYVYLTDGSAVRLQPKRMTPSLLEGTSPGLGSCQLPVANIRQLRLGPSAPVPGDLLYADWIRKPAPEPVLPEEGEGKGAASKVVNREADDFTVRLLSDDTFQLSKEKGRVVVLNFWASWSGQSRQCLAELIKAVDAYSGQVRFVTVNQAEPAALVRKYLERNGWSFDVAIDRSEKIGNGFGIESIPHTVLVDATGKIRWAESGYRLGIGAEVAGVLDDLVKEAAALEPELKPEEAPEVEGEQRES